MASKGPSSEEQIDPSAAVTNPRNRERGLMFLSFEPASSTPSNNSSHDSFSTSPVPPHSETSLHPLHEAFVTAFVPLPLRHFPSPLSPIISRLPAVGLDPPNGDQRAVISVDFDPPNGDQRPDLAVILLFFLVLCLELL